VSRLVVRNIGELVTCWPRVHESGHRPAAQDNPALGVVRQAALICEGDAVLWVGKERDLPELASEPKESHTIIDARGGTVLPGLVDNHTHLVYAGDRVGEFWLRCQGASYEEIARAGGGIATTVAATRAASEEQLLVGTERRLAQLLRFGVTTVEIKSGYGLSTAHELKLLRVVKRLAKDARQVLVPTFLGAHTVPAERKAQRGAYVDEVVTEMLPEVAREGLAEYCDVFCETAAFSVAETRRVLEAAAQLGLGLRVHAEQLHHTGATSLAVELGAASVDHLEHINAHDVEALAASTTVATLLPGASLFLNQAAQPPARALLDSGVAVALSTDCNPGTCPTQNLPLIGTLGCCRLGMTPAEALLALTVAPAKSLGREGRVGVLRPGARADAVWLASERFENMFYQLGVSPVAGVLVGGTIAHWDFTTVPS
jgi:imidazolonepropionase